MKIVSRSIIIYYITHNYNIVATVYGLFPLSTRYPTISNYNTYNIINDHLPITAAGQSRHTRTDPIELPMFTEKPSMS